MPAGNNISKTGKKLIIRTVLTPLAGAVVLMIAAGRVTWFWGWLYSGLWAAYLYSAFAAIYYKHPELINHRAQFHDNVKEWDIKLIAFFPLFTWSMIAVAGLDGGRFQFTHVPNWLQWCSAGVFIFGAFIAATAAFSNRHFESMVRIQTDRDHQVCTQGPYRFIRHPGYAGTILTVISGALILDSWLALLPACGNAVIFIVRTVKEDRTLAEELNGYTAYRKTVRARLIPGLW